MNKPAASPPPSPPPPNKAADAASKTAPNSAPKTAPKSAPQSAPPKVKKKKGGLPWRRTLLLIIVVAGAAVYYLPAQVESLTGIGIPSFVPSHAATQAKKAERAEQAADTADTAETTTPGQPPDMPQAQEEQQSQAQQTQQAQSNAEDLTTHMRQLRQGADSTRRDIGAVAARVQSNEQQLTRLAGQVADISKRQDSNLLQLQIIALQLQLSGDTHAAADALNRLAIATEDTAAARAMLDEAARIKNIAPRDTLLTVLDEILLPKTAGAAAASASAKNPTATSTSASTSAADTDDSGWLGTMKQLFNYSESTARASLSPMAQQMAQLQLHLLTRRNAAYWAQLQQMHADQTKNGRGDERVRDILQRLHDYGAPDYQLRLP